MVTKEQANKMMLDSTVESGKQKSQNIHLSLLEVKVGTHELQFYVEDSTTKAKLAHAEEELQKALDATMQALLTFREIQNDQVSKELAKLNQLVKRG